jgi:WD40 repeat protein
MFDCIKELWKKNIPKPENIISDENIYSICVLSNTHIVYGNHKGEIIWYNITKKEELCKKKVGERGIIYIEAINSKKFITCSYNSVINIWKTDYDECFKIDLKGSYCNHTDCVTKAVLLDQKNMITSSLDKSIRIWNTKKQKDLLIIDKNSFGIESFIKVKDEDLIISSDAHGMLNFWNFSLDEKKYSLEKILMDCRTINANSMSELPNKKLLIGDYKVMKIIDIKSMQIETVCMSDDPINVILSIKDLIIIGLKNGKIRLTDIKSLEQYNQIENKNKDIMQELNIKGNEKIRNNENFFQNSPIINIKTTKQYFILATNEEINFYEIEKYNKMNDRQYKVD